MEGTCEDAEMTGHMDNLRKVQELGVLGLRVLGQSRGGRIVGSRLCQVREESRLT